MMERTQIMLDAELQKRARKRASQLGISLAEYVRRLLARDLGARQTAASAAWCSPWVIRAELTSRGTKMRCSGPRSLDGVRTGARGRAERLRRQLLVVRRR
jgi:hypothetical protein